MRIGWLQKRYITAKRGDQGNIANVDMFLKCSIPYVLGHTKSPHNISVDGLLSLMSEGVSSLIAGKSATLNMKIAGVCRLLMLIGCTMIKDTPNKFDLIDHVEHIGVYRGRRDMTGEKKADSSSHQKTKDVYETRRPLRRSPRITKHHR